MLRNLYDSHGQLHADCCLLCWGRPDSPVCYKDKHVETMVHAAPWYNTYAAHYKEAECFRLAIEEILYDAGVDMIFAGACSCLAATSRQLLEVSGLLAYLPGASNLAQPLQCSSCMDVQASRWRGSVLQKNGSASTASSNSI